MTDAAHEAYALYRKSNDRNDLDVALERFQEVLDLCPDGHPQRGAALSNLAHVILHGFSKGMQTDIDYVISLFRSALELCPEGHPDHLISILNLCEALHQRHLYLQDNANLREAVKLYLDLLPLCVDGSYLQLRIIEECNALPRDPSDESILLRRKVIGLCRLHCQYHPRSLSRLAGDLYARFEESGDTDDINEAVHLSREALTECPDDGRSFFLSVLAYTLKLRFHHLRHPDDINECISLNRNALDLRPPGHPARQRSLNNLAKALKARYDQYGDMTDFEESLTLARDAHDLRSGNPWTSPPPHEHSQEHADLRQSQSTHPPEPEVGQQRQPPPELPTSDHQVRAS
jgi:tetratricopeptide (TPR) repeat protein